MAESILVKKSYFTNADTAADAINKFIGSNYKEKNFPVLDDSSEMDPSIVNILNTLNSVEPSWVTDPSKFEDASNDLKTSTNDEDVVDKADAVNSYSGLQNISNNSAEFANLLDGIRSFELFTVPAKFRTEIELFNNSPVFSLTDYVKGLFNSPDIQFPNSMDCDTEIERVSQYKPLTQDIPVITDETIQEAAEINYFEDAKPQHIKYDSKGKKFILSDQLKKAVDDLIAELKKCDEPKDLRTYFTSKEASKVPDMLSSNIMPFVLAKVYNNTSKFPSDSFDIKNLEKFIKSYKSIGERNPGAKRFVNYDIFSTFKIDKDGTIDFVKDFLTLNLVNSEKARITNNGLLSCFNIFDSRIYLDTLYNLIPNEDRKDKFETEDGFVKFVRARINKNSRNSNVYAEDEADEEPDNSTKTEKEVQESLYIMMKQFGDMSLEDMHLCEQYHAMLYTELNTLDSKAFMEGISMIDIGKEINTIITETYDGKIPEYMQTRVKLTDDEPGVTVTPVATPDIPSNPIPDLAGSIDDKIGMADDYTSMLGSGASTNGANVVYNITNNYNSNNTTTVNKNKKKVVKNVDNSSGKTTTTDDHSTGKHEVINKNRANSKVIKDSYNNHFPGNKKNDDEPFNNKYNSEDRDDTSEEENTKFPGPETEGLDDENLQEFDTGISVNDLFAFLEDGELSSSMASREEPLSNGINTMKKPSSDMLTTAMDVDRNTLSFQQRAKKKIEKGIQTIDTATKPISRAKQWLAGIVDTLISRREAKVKEEIIENPSYRTVLFKAGRLATKLGMFGILFTINGYIGAAYAVASVSGFADRERMKKEVQREFGANIEILTEKIAIAKQQDTPESRKAAWEMMRVRSYMEDIVAGTPKSVFKTSNTIV